MELNNSSQLSVHKHRCRFMCRFASLIITRLPSERCTAKVCWSGANWPTSWFIIVARFYFARSQLPRAQRENGSSRSFIWLFLWPRLTLPHPILTASILHLSTANWVGSNFWPPALVVTPPVGKFAPRWALPATSLGAAREVCESAVLCVAHFAQNLSKRLPSNRTSIVRLSAGKLFLTGLFVWHIACATRFWVILSVNYSEQDIEVL